MITGAGRGGVCLKENVGRLCVWGGGGGGRRQRIPQKTRLCISLAYSEPSLICVCLCSIHFWTDFVDDVFVTKLI